MIFKSKEPGSPDIYLDVETQDSWKDGINKMLPIFRKKKTEEKEGNEDVW